jgi:hypothetical protein
MPEPKIHPAALKLVEVTTGNWRAVAAVHPRPDQGRFVAATTYYHRG